MTYESLNDGTIARIMLNRPDACDAQNRGMLVEIDEAFKQTAPPLIAAAKDKVRAD